MLLQDRNIPKGSYIYRICRRFLGLFGIASVLLPLVFHGKGGMSVGAMGLAAMALSVYGFVLGLRSFSQKNRNQLYCKIGAVANGSLMVLWLALFFVGIS